MVFDVSARIHELGVVPVLAVERAEAALPLGDALLEGGLPIAEVTFRTDAAAEVIQTLSSERPDLLVGAGTVLTVDQLKAAVACGAKFAVAPGLNPEVVRAAGDYGLPFMPGVATATDIEAALALGCDTLKYFPAELMGGIKMLKALYGPYGHTGVRFLPTGGVSEDNLAAYLGEPFVAAVGGTWVARKDDIAEGRWEAIAERCRRIGEIRSAARSDAS